MLRPAENSNELARASSKIQKNITFLSIQVHLINLIWQVEALKYKKQLTKYLLWIQYNRKHISFSKNN